MYSKEENLHLITEASGWTQIPCFEVALLEDKPLESCFGNNGMPVCYWPRDINYDCCNHWLIIDLNYLGLHPRDFFKLSLFVVLLTKWHISGLQVPVAKIVVNLHHILLE